MRYLVNRKLIKSSTPLTEDIIIRIHIYEKHERAKDGIWVLCKEDHGYIFRTENSTGNVRFGWNSYHITIGEAIHSVKDSPLFFDYEQVDTSTLIP